ncbi:hypothetical protein B0H15DRAFT_312096 [Mycena belliarum]|uniref:LYR motif-containing protein Cup1-like N-terminal domain-containing protein n=1 Tax=Mycena belliarum TaxID=1033014 RepID=A0AAD6Y0X6_9AGAR|nr:hypothetical protein B0H15DRAFT_312096 [Mycena belliae]
MFLQNLLLPPHNRGIFGLYKAFLRQTRKLPHLYLRQFWRIKAYDDVRSILKTDNIHGARERKLKRMVKDLRKLEAGNNRNTKAFNHVLAVAYGRKGKLKRELMQPILTDPTAPIPSKIIPAVESSRPPVYSKELKALLFSGVARTTKPLTARQLELPPTLPARADPGSPEARLLGPFSKRRETNARWRYFVAEWQKVRPPLHTVIETRPVNAGGNTLEDVYRTGIRSLPMEGLYVFEDVENLAGPSSIRPSETYNAPTRWLRRRYRELLTRIPILNYTVSPANKTPRCSVSLSPHTNSQLTAARVDTSDLGWMTRQDAKPVGIR